mmetsp:Transcript_21841/g.65495  ORF Transcript_21841/g.65495 Transcript_21841/m.65495 type:complete len:167 (-) Transcript_21841:70-570(-)
MDSAFGSPPTPTVKQRVADIDATGGTPPDTPDKPALAKGSSVGKLFAPVEFSDDPAAASAPASRHPLTPGFSEAGDDRGLAAERDDAIVDGKKFEGPMPSVPERAEPEPVVDNSQAPHDNMCFLGRLIHGCMPSASPDDEKMSEDELIPAAAPADDAPATGQPVGK